MQYKNLPSGRNDIQDGQTGHKLRNTIKAGGTAKENRQVDGRVGRWTGD